MWRTERWKESGPQGHREALASAVELPLLPAVCFGNDTWPFRFTRLFLAGQNILTGVLVLEEEAPRLVTGPVPGRVSCVVWTLPEVAGSIVVVSCPWQRHPSHESHRNLLPTLIRQTDPASFLCQIPGVDYNKISGLGPTVVFRAFSFMGRQMFGKAYFSEYSLYKL